MKASRILAMLIVAALAASSVLAGTCRTSSTPRPAFPFVMCKERTNTTTGGPWIMPFTNLGSFSIAYRQQYLYPTAIVGATGALTLESFHARTGIGNANQGVDYTNPAGNQDCYVRVFDSPLQALAPANQAGNFAQNLVGASAAYMNYFATAASPIQVRLTSSQNVILAQPGVLDLGTSSTVNLSDFINRKSGTLLDRNDLDTPISITGLVAANRSVLVDMKLRNMLCGGAQNCNPISAFLWDTTDTACAGPQQAFGNSSQANPSWESEYQLLNNQAFVWVFRGLIPPQPATLEQQVAEIIRLLVTPESLRCTGIDLVVDGKTSDDPITFGSGKNYDPISPLVTNDGIPTGEEAGEGAGRKHGLAN